MSTNPAALDEAKLFGFIGKVVEDMGAGASCALALIGVKLGLYRALAEGPATSKELAARTGTNERYLREWLVNQAAGGYIEYDASAQRYSIPKEHAFALSDDGPASVVGGFQIVAGLVAAQPRIREAFRTGAGMRWGEHVPDVFEGTERFFRTAYVRNLTSQWIPAIEGMTARLQQGGKVADIGCGHGASTIIMAQAFPKSRFHGFDSHAPSIERAREAAKEADVADRAIFEVADSASFPGDSYDFACYFDCLHDMGEPGQALAHARKSLAKDGAAMIVEPMAGKRTEDNFNPVGRLYSAASVLCCTPNAVATGRTHLGTIPPDDVLASIAKEAGFASFRRAWEDPFNRVFEARG